MSGDTVLGAALAQALDLGAPEQPQEQAQPAQEAETPVEDAVQPEGETSEQELAQEPESDDAAITKFTDLKRLFGDDVTDEDLYGLEFTSGVDGKNYTVGQLKDMLQQRESFDQQRKAFEVERQQAAEQIEQMKQQALLNTQQVQQIPDELRQAEAEVLAIQQQAQAQDWQQLEQDDPGQAALLRQKYNDAYNAAVAKRGQMVNKWQQDQLAAQQQFVARQREVLLQAKPEWRDQSAFDAAFTRMAGAVQDIGITPDDLRGITDPRVALLVDKYAELKAQMDGAKANEKQVRERGKRVLRAPAAVQGKLNRTQQIIDRAKRQDATKQDKFAAERELVQQLGII